MEAFVACPEQGIRGQLGCYEQMRIDIADSYAEEFMANNKVENFIVGRDLGHREIAEIAHNISTMLEIAHGKFTDD